MAAARCPRAVGGADAEDPREPSSATPPPARWGHCALPHEAWLHSRVQVVDGLDGVASREPAARRREGGRGLFVSGGAGDAPVAAGTLLAEEAPVILATDYAALERYLLAVCGGAPGARLPADSSVAVLSGESEATLRHAILSLVRRPGRAGRHGAAARARRPLAQHAQRRPAAVRRQAARARRARWALADGLSDVEEGSPDRHLPLLPPFFPCIATAPPSPSRLHRERPRGSPCRRLPGPRAA
ncbi:unnamed protein product [Prorocentrum cordatum]|uniref:Uncharacterized protein n=1 Tax=Prorocentrum cordatum TaxID=2364126 RepID=A0ABN9RUL7_9DINO|nr:unnamed protein product [Polarella glacialis]